MAREGQPTIILSGRGASENISYLNDSDFLKRSKSDTDPSIAQLSSGGKSKTINNIKTTLTSLDITSKLEELSLNQTDNPGLLPRGKIRSSDSDNPTYSSSIRQRYGALNPTTSKKISDNNPMYENWIQSDVYAPVTYPTGAYQNRQIFFQHIPGVYGSSIDATRPPFVSHKLPLGVHSNIPSPSDLTTTAFPRRSTGSYENNAIFAINPSCPSGSQLYPTSETVGQKLNCMPPLSGMNNDKWTSDHFHSNQHMQDSKKGNVLSEDNLNDGEKTSDCVLPPELANRLMYIINSDTVFKKEMTEQLKGCLNKQPSNDTIPTPTKNPGSTNSNGVLTDCSISGKQVNNSDSPNFLDSNEPNSRIPYPIARPFRGTNNYQYPTSPLAHSMTQTTTIDFNDIFNPTLNPSSGFTGNGFGNVETSWSTDPSVTNTPSQKSKENPNKLKIGNVQLNAPPKYVMGNPLAQRITPVAPTITVNNHMPYMNKPSNVFTMPSEHCMSSKPTPVRKIPQTVTMDPNNPGRLLPTTTGTIVNTHGISSTRPKSIGALVQASSRAAPCPIIFDNVTGVVPSSPNQNNKSISQLHPAQRVPQPNSAASNSASRTSMAIFCPTSLNLARRKVAGISREKLIIQDGDGDTFLHLATCNSNSYQMKAVLERYTRENLLKDVIDKRNNLGQTPLYVATADNKTMATRELISYGANPNHMVQCNGMRKIMKAPIHCAAQGGLPFVTTLRELLNSKDLILDLCNSEGLTALHCAIQEHGKAEGGYKKTSIVTTQMLIKAGADPNAQDKKSGKTPLMYAIETKDYDLVECMVNLIDKDKLRHMLKTQTFDGSNCSKICSGLRMDTEGWKAMNSLLFSVEVL